ncbi:MAG TPA: MBL fold metallo-hydrolase [Planctomycetaceae bacterium]|jgi:metallo-beta-lactamase family protein|nr:MBL fold metallo-hydrolase [Planctomycetaceae bacterium]
MKLTFLGGAGEVTGSQHLLETDTLRILLDCGLFQGHRAEAYSKNRHFRCGPGQLDAVILSHAHIDHCGNLPGLFRAGFRGPVYCTPATADLTAIMLRDSLHIQQEDARYLSRHATGADGPPIEPLYGEEDVRGIVKLLEPLEDAGWHELSPAMRMQFTNAGHILGSAITQFDIEDRGDVHRVVFTGDLGRRGLPLLCDPQLVEGCDVLITESTYADAIHPPPEDLKARLIQIIERADETSGKVVIPAFSLGRTQQVVYYLRELAQAGKLPRMPIFVDSPLANRVTEVFGRYREHLDSAALQVLPQQGDLFDFPMLAYIESPQQSMELNRREGPFVVIAGSGMCENGRVRHHLKHAVEDERNTIVLIGFQAAHTLGRRLAERRPTVKILDRVLELRARVESLGGLSAHADAEDFKWFFSQMSADSHIGRAFIVHGEPPAAHALNGILHDLCDEDPTIPRLYESFEV